MMLVIWPVFVIAGTLLMRRLRRPARRFSTAQSVLTGLTRAAWILLCIFGGIFAFIRTFMIYDLYLFFNDDRRAHVAACIGFSADDTVRLTKFIRAFGGPDGTAVTLTFTADAPPADCIAHCCLGTVTDYSVDGLIYNQNTENGAEPRTVRQVTADPDCTALYQYTWNGKRYTVLFFESDGKTTGTVRY